MLLIPKHHYFMNVRTYAPRSRRLDASACLLDHGVRRWIILFFLYL